jgi:CBS domain-containing protein
MSHPVETLPATMPIADAVTFFTAAEGAARFKSYPVVDAKGMPVWMVSRADILRWSREGWPPGGTLQDAAGDLMIAYADELVGHLADRMAVADVGRVPIIERQSRQLVGLVARRDLLRARTRVRTEEQHRAKLLHVRR